MVCKTLIVLQIDILNSLQSNEIDENEEFLTPAFNFNKTKYKILPN